MRIQHNIMAMNAYRNYNNNTSALSRNLEKLSSGYKINRAGDDAAGLAISEKMRAQITGLDAAQKNVKDGISLVKTAEGAMQEVQDMLNRMVYLATQSANGTYDNEVDRANLQKEVDQLKSEINRIADSANFNGIKLLDGSLEAKTETINAQDLKDSLTLQHDGRLAVAPQAGVYTIDFSQLQYTNAATTAKGITKINIGGTTLAISTATLKAVANGGTIDGKLIVEHLVAKNATATIAGNQFSLAVEGDGILKLTMKKAPASSFAATNIDVEITAASLTSNNGEQFAPTEITAAVPTTGRLYAQATLALTAGQIVDGAALKIGDTTYTFAVGKDSKFKGLANVVDLTDKTADSADLLDAAINRLTTVAQDNKQFYVGTSLKAGAPALTFTEKEGGIDYAVNNLAGVTTGTDGDWTGLITLGQVDANKMQSGLTLQIGDTSEHYNQLKVNIKDMHVTALGIDVVDISTVEGAAEAINTIKTAINTVSSVRGDLGATQNRLEHTANNLSVMEENIQDAESTIRDTDIAEEMMAYTKNNILVQSAQAMLAQANMVPQGVLQLLG